MLIVSPAVTTDQGAKLTFVSKFKEKKKSYFAHMHHRVCLGPMRHLFNANCRNTENGKVDILLLPLFFWKTV